ncbi:MAG: DNA polymerase III subunit gamma/tau [Microbacterium sp.]|mgnify:CR=1 FL=1|nr:DNA polymerase III subunit gamma/tau [Microbacterium sp.]
MTPRDRDALSWDGDDDPTLDTGSHVDGPVDDETEVGSERADGATGSAAPIDLPPGYTAVGRGSEGVAPSDGESAAAADVEVSAGEDASTGEDSGDPADEVVDTPSIGNAALIALGVLGGVYLLYTVGWIVGGLRLQDVAQFLVAPVAYQVALWMAVAAPAIWFAVTVLLTRRSRSWVRFAWLAAGVVLLVPWPFAMIGAIGQ